MFDRVSMPLLIRSGYATLIVLMICMLVGGYIALQTVTQAFNGFKTTTAQAQILGDLAEDTFEARVAALKYRATSDAETKDAVHSNVAEITDDPTINRAFADRPTLDATLRDVQTDLTAYSASFDAIAVRMAEVDQFALAMSETGADARKSLSDIRQTAYENGDSVAAYNAAVMQENLMLGRYYATRYALTADMAHYERAVEQFGQAERDLARLQSSLFGAALAQEVRNVSERLGKMIETMPLMRTAIEARDQIAERDLDATGVAVQNQIETVLEQVLDRQSEQGDAARALAMTIGNMVIVAGILLSLVALAAAFGVSQVVTARIRQLAQTTDALVAGDLSVKIAGQERSDETGRLARALVVFRDTQAEREEQRARDIQAEQDRETVVQSLSNGLSRMSGGDLTVRMTTQLAEGFEPLRHDFNTAVARLSEAFSGVIRETEGIRGGAENLSSAADELARRTEGQAAALEETAATIVQLTDSVTETATGAGKANSFVTNTREAAEGSLTVVASTVDAIKKIQATSAQVSQIIGVIDDIAFQTNLLALNAGVEAARAGDAGQGFAVVASEVRALAQRASTAAKEIKDLIETSVQQVDEGVVKADQTGEALGKIVGMVTEISDLVATISSETQNQSDGLKEINAAVSQLDSVTQENAAMVEETTAASHDLTRNSTELTRIANGFQTDIGQQAFVSQRSDPEDVFGGSDLRVAV